MGFHKLFKDGSVCSPGSKEGFSVKVLKKEEQYFIFAFKLHGNWRGFTSNLRQCGFFSCCKAIEVGGIKLGINKHDCVAVGLFLPSVC